ncbi:MAG: hypothetical protein AUJ96_09770 [Armatimonadetes bacterium CG2_30_66_41]|nr:MAG: hypothetical protein AUJ96_09770 [Armatimonadetes bacterium CG2_30_66_41]
MGRWRAPVVLLCEDRQQETFARSFLLARGFRHDQIRSVVCPSGRGAGEKFVRARFAQELCAIRRRPVAPSLGVLIDDDGVGTQQRLGQLGTACDDAGEPRRSVEDSVGVFVPSRNIETWLRFLEGQSVDENTNYKSPGAAVVGCRPHVRQLLHLCASGLPDDAPRSLRAACPEAERLCGT